MCDLIFSIKRLITHSKIQFIFKVLRIRERIVVIIHHPINKWDFTVKRSVNIFSVSNSVRIKSNSFTFETTDKRIELIRK
ncbi:Uncharacterised protein [Serratia entomophila]|nr:Uncharacterised protein [Serratia entomophila]